MTTEAITKILNMLEAMIEPGAVIMALSLLKLGPSMLSKLETHLATMTIEERKLLARMVLEASPKILAPQIVFYDYEAQTWLV